MHAMVFPSQSISPSNVGTQSGLTLITLADIPENHPVALFAQTHATLTEGVFLPHEHDILKHRHAARLLDWSKHIEPIEIKGEVDFKVLHQGSKIALREKRSYQDKWMSETLDPEFVEARYREMTAAAILRKPMFSRGAIPSRERSFINVLRGIFPVFAENHARMRIFEIAAEPYITME